MEIEEAFTSYLLTLWADPVIWADMNLWDEANGNLITLIINRFFPEELPQGTLLPAVSYLKVSDVKNHTLQGQVKIERPVFQFSVFALTKAVARGVANKLKSALQDYVGTMGDIEIQHIKLLNEMSGLEKSPDGTVKVYTEDLEFEINFERS